MNDPVLVVNDDLDSGELIARLVEAAGWPAVRCSDSAEVMTQLREGKWSGVVLDLKAGTIACLPLLGTIRGEETPIESIPVLVLTSTRDSELQAWQAGADGFLRRPFHAADLTYALTDALRRTPAERDAYRRSRVEAQSA